MTKTPTPIQQISGTVMEWAIEWAEPQNSKRYGPNYQDPGKTMARFDLRMPTGETLTLWIPYWRFQKYCDERRLRIDEHHRHPWIIHEHSYNDDGCWMEGATFTAMVRSDRIMRIIDIGHDGRQ